MLVNGKYQPLDGSAEVEGMSFETEKNAQAISFSENRCLSFCLSIFLFNPHSLNL